MKKLADLEDAQLVNLVNNRWEEPAEIWTKVSTLYDANTKQYDNEPVWLDNLPRKKSKVRANRIFVDQESVINALIANPPRPNVLPGRSNPESKALASLQEKYFNKKYDQRNVKETLRMGLRNLYFSRLIVLKPFWNNKIDDFDVRSLDPRTIRVGKSARKEEESEFVIEEIEDSLRAMLKRFPSKKDAILKEAALDEDEILIRNPMRKYKEAWVQDRLIFVFGSILLGNIPNPYWDWDGLLITDEEEQKLNSEGADALVGQPRRDFLTQIKNQQPERRNQKTMAQAQVAAAGTETPAAPDDNAQTPIDINSNKNAEPAEAPQPAEPQEGQEGQSPVQNPNQGDKPSANEDQSEPMSFKSYFFNHFDQVRKPYIFATVYNNEQKPIGRTDMISQAAPLQEGIDKRKRQIDENCDIVNGIIKVDSKTLDKEDAQKLRWETGGVIWGKNVKDGVTRESGTVLPQFVFEDMKDSRDEIDNIMAASSAFRGEREGQETKAGRLALIQQSQGQLNELTQVIDFVCQELFNWWYQLAKVRYTEYHYAKSMGNEAAMEILELIQDDFEDGSEVSVIAGKTLPNDRQFLFDRAQKDVQAGIITPIDYFEAAGYDDPKQTAKDAFLFKANPVAFLGLTDEEKQIYAAQKEPEDKPSLSISFKDLPPDGKIQAAAMAGIKLDQQVLAADEADDHAKSVKNKAPVPLPQNQPTNQQP